MCAALKPDTRQLSVRFRRHGGILETHTATSHNYDSGSRHFGIVYDKVEISKDVKRERERERGRGKDGQRRDLKQLIERCSKESKAGDSGDTTCQKCTIPQSMGRKWTSAFLTDPG